MQIETKIVAFEVYCSKCKYAKTEDMEDPCNECLTNPTNINSHKPVNFEEL